MTPLGSFLPCKGESPLARLERELQDASLRRRLDSIKRGQHKNTSNNNSHISSSSVSSSRISHNRNARIAASNPKPKHKTCHDSQRNILADQPEKQNQNQGTVPVQFLGTSMHRRQLNQHRVRLSVADSRLKGDNQGSVAVQPLGNSMYRSQSNQGPVALSVTDSRLKGNKENDKLHINKSPKGFTRLDSSGSDCSNEGIQYLNSGNKSSKLAAAKHRSKSRFRDKSATTQAAVRVPVVLDQRGKAVDIDTVMGSIRTGNILDSTTRKQVRPKDKSTIRNTISMRNKIEWARQDYSQTDDGNKTYPRDGIAHDLLFAGLDWGCDSGGVEEDTLSFEYTCLPKTNKLGAAETVRVSNGFIGGASMDKNVSPSMKNISSSSLLRREYFGSLQKKQNDRELRRLESRRTNTTKTNAWSNLTTTSGRGGVPEDELLLPWILS